MSLYVSPALFFIAVTKCLCELLGGPELSVICSTRRQSPSVCVQQYSATDFTPDFSSY